MIERDVRPPTEPHDPLTEAAACERIADAISDRALALGCWVTTHACPYLLRLETGAACLLYDPLLVDACAATLAVSNVCGDLTELPCGPLAIADSAPAGCDGAGGSGEADLAR